MSYSINGKIIPPIAVGTWAWGSGMNGSKMVFGTAVEEELLKECFDIALEGGFRLFDTAAVYGMGEAERILGELSKNENIILSDKFTPSKGFSQRKIDTALNGSTEKLNGKIPDIYWLHSPQNIEKNLEYFCELKRQNKIGGIGVSNFGFEDLMLAVDVLKRNGCKLSGVQNHFSLLYRRSEEVGVLDWCKNNGVPFFAYMVLEQGALTEKYNKNNPMPRFSRRGMTFTKSKLKKTEPLIKLLESVGNKYNITVSETAVAWSISKGCVPIIGVTKPYQAESLKRSADATLTADDVKFLEDTAKATGISIGASWENY